MNALMTGEVDVINRVDTKVVSLLKRNSNIILEETKGAQHYTFPMLVDSPVFQDNNVRLAMKHAVDREAIVKNILHGYGTVGNDHCVSPGSSYFNHDMEQRSFDPDKVDFYLKKAGLDRLPVTINASDAAFGGAVDAAILFQEATRSTKIDLNVVREPADGYWSNVWGKKPLCTSFWYSSLTPERIMGLGYAKDSGWNETHWKNERFEQLLATVRAENEETKRREIYNDMQALVSDEGGAIVPVFASALAARSNKITHSGVTSPWGELDGLRVIERWWQA
jgi:peptide/nickel transport system substrate-binding protein